MSIWELVERQRARVLRLLATTAVLRAAAALAFVLLAGALALGGTRWMTLPRIVPFLVWGAALAVSAWMLRRGLAASRRASAPVAIADAVEREQKLRRGAVRGLVELAHDTSAFVRLASQRMGATLASAGTTLAPDLERKLRRAGFAASLVFLPAAALLVLGAARHDAGLRALAHPGAAWRGTLLPALTLADAPRRVMRGATVRLTIGAAGRTEIALRRRVTGNAWVEQIVPVHAGVAQAEVGPLDADLTVVASDGRATSDTAVVRVVDRPFLGDVAVRAVYPAYLHKPSETLPGDAGLRVPKGTELFIDGHASEPLASVTLAQGRDSVRLEPADRRFSGHFAPRETGSWAWSAKGLTTAIADVPSPLVIDVVPDSAPTAEILSPASDSLIQAKDKVELQLLATDDHALASVTLKIWKVYKDGRSELPAMEKLGGGMPEFATAVTLNLATFELGAGDAVHVQLLARDQTPWGQEGVSRELILRVPATEEQRIAARAAADSAAARAAAAAKAEAQLMQRTTDAANQRGAPNQPGKNGQQTMAFDKAQQQKQLATDQKQMADRVQQLQQASKQLEDRLKAAGALDTALAQQLREAQRMLREALTPDMLEALKKLDNATQNLSAEQSKQSLQQLAEQQKKMREALEKSAEILKRAALEGTMQTLKDEARELAKQQREAMDSAARRTPADAAKEMAKRTDQLAKDIKALKDRLEKENADPAAKKASEALADAMKAKDELEKELGAQQQGQQGKQGDKKGQQGEQKGSPQPGQQGQPGQKGQQGQQGQSGAPGEKQQGGNQQGGQKGAQGGQAGNDAADAMDRAADALSEGRKQQVEEWKHEVTGELDQSIQEMMQLARQQDQLAQRAKQNPTDPSLRSEQSALQQGVQKASERLQSESKRSALVSPKSQKAVSDAEQKVGQAARDAQEQRTMQQASASMSDAANALRSAVSSLARDRERAGNSQSASGLPELLAQLQQLAQSQGSLNGQMQSFLQMAQQAKAQQQSLSDDAKAQGRALAKGQRDVARQLDEAGDVDQSGRAAELAREARQLAQSLEQGAVDPSVLERQQRLFKRMLDAGKALENDQTDESGRRESKPGDQNNPFVPPSGNASGRAALKYRVPEWNELRGLSADERRLVIEYFRRLNGDKP